MIKKKSWMRWKYMSTLGGPIRVPSLKLYTYQHANLTAAPKLLSNIMWPNEEDLLMIWYMGGQRNRKSFELLLSEAMLTLRDHIEQFRYLYYLGCWIFSLT